MREHLRLLISLEDSYEVVDVEVYVRSNEGSVLAELIYLATMVEQFLTRPRAAGYRRAKINACCYHYGREPGSYIGTTQRSSLPK